MLTMQASIVILEGLLTLTTPVLSEFRNEIRPDVTFGDHNDRFDVSDLVSYQNKYFRSDGSIDYRRSHGSKRIPKFLRTGWNPDDRKWLVGSERARKKLAKRVKKEAEEQLNRLANVILLRMKSRRHVGDDFAFHDDMESDGGDVYSFNDNLQKFKRVTTKSDGGHRREPYMGYRRIGTFPETFDYAFPIEMQVKGYLVPPESR